MKKEFDSRMHSAEHLLNQTMDRMFGCGLIQSYKNEEGLKKIKYHYQAPSSRPIFNH